MDKVKIWLGQALRVGSFLMPLLISLVVFGFNIRDGLKTNTEAVKAVGVELTALRADMTKKVSSAEVEAQINAALMRLRITDSLAELKIQVSRAADDVKELRLELRK